MSPAPGASGPLVSLLLPNRDNARVLGVVLDRLARNTTYPRTELVAVDDGSTDGSIEILRGWADSARIPGFQLIEQEHAGAIAALNAGLAVASGEVVVQLDADASVETPGWIERMLGLLMLDESVGVVSAKVVIDSGVLHACGVDVVGPEGLHDRLTRITEPVGRRTWHQRVERFAEGTTQQEHRVAEVDAGIGCCMMYRRADALAAGGYDAGFSPVWFDDIDLCLGIRLGGKKVFYTPDVRVLHRLGVREAATEPGRGPRASAVGRARRVASRAGSGWPAARAALARGMGLNRPPEAHRDRLRHHYAYWLEKWGWDPLNPNMDEVRRRYGDSELCWSLDPGRRAAGEAIVERFERNRDVSSAEERDRAAAQGYRRASTRS
ncbi:MAG: glycosyltransferase family 2 protein [Thermoleophilaceae bacterium]